MSFKSIMTAIADALRAKTGKTDKVTLNQIPTEINNVYEAGKKAEYDAFWDAYQENGNRQMYSYAFSGMGWNAETFKPKYVIKPGSGNFAYGLFALFNYGNPNLDFRNYAHLLDLSNVTIGTYMFQDARFDFIDLDLSKFTSLQSAFSEGWSSGKKTTITLKVSEKCTSFNACFSYCTALTNLTFKDGSVIAVTLNLQHSPLTKESIISVVNALSQNVTSQTVTFKKSAKEAAFTDDEWSELIATKPNWTFSLL